MMPPERTDDPHGGAKVGLGPQNRKPGRRHEADDRVRHGFLLGARPQPSDRRAPGIRSRLIPSQREGHRSQRSVPGIPGPQRDAATEVHRTEDEARAPAHLDSVRHLRQVRPEG